MRIAFVQTYPVYHDLLSSRQWLARQDRERWMAADTAAMGHEVELWAIDRTSGVYPGDGFTIRTFRPDSAGPESKFHTSEEALAHARSFAPDLCVLKGVDGGLGEHLIEALLEPKSIPFAFIVGGKFYTRHVPRASAVLYEVELQRERLQSPRVPWRRPVDPSRLIRLPKIVDLERFKPEPGVEKRWDLLSVGRLVTRIKGFEALAGLPRDLSIAVLGGGPDRARLEAQFPWIEWLGPADPADVPSYLVRTRLLFHPGRREYMPRVLAEAAACGIPSVAFADVFAEDVLPSTRGLRVTPKTMAGEVRALLGDPARLERLGIQCRAEAELRFGRHALHDPLLSMLRRSLPGSVA